MHITYIAGAAAGTYAYMVGATPPHTLLTVSCIASLAFLFVAVLAKSLLGADSELVSDAASVSALIYAVTGRRSSATTHVDLQ